MVKILSLTEDNAEKIIKESLKALKNGGIVAYPTESFYGLGVNAFNETALQRLYELKKRPVKKPMPLIVGSKKTLKSIVKSIPIEAGRLIKRFWPGALTIVFDALDDLPEVLTAGTGKVAVRIPGDRFALKLARASGFPITATSANLSSRPSARKPEEIINYFGEGIDLIIDAGETPGGKPSTIVDVTVKPPRVLRKGRIIFAP